MSDSWMIKRLSRDSHHLTTVATWQFQQWHHLSSITSFDAWRQELCSHCGPKGVPSVFIALIDGQPVGTASLVQEDMEIRRELTPWLASMFVAPEWRGQGIASRLVRRVEAEARQTGIERFYLFTPDQQALYRRLGWANQEALVYRGEEVTIMERRLVI